MTPTSAHPHFIPTQTQLKNNCQFCKLHSLFFICSTITFKLINVHKRGGSNRAKVSTNQLINWVNKIRLSASTFRVFSINSTARHKFPTLSTINCQLQSILMINVHLLNRVSFRFAQNLLFFVLSATMYPGNNTVLAIHYSFLLSYSFTWHTAIRLKRICKYRKPVNFTWPCAYKLLITLLSRQLANCIFRNQILFTLE
jgi:hypothetical protein